MSFYNEDIRDLETLEDIIPCVPEKTNWNAYETDAPEVTTKKVTLKNVNKIRKQIKKIRKFNDYKAIESKRNLAQRLYNEIRVKLLRADETKRQELREYIKSLRPPMRVLKQHYLAKGDPPEVVDKLVNYKSYPTLPNVWITKKHQTVLLDVINGQADKHDAYIKQGFKNI